MVDDRSEFEERDDSPEIEENYARTRPQPFVREPEYQELLQKYQNGELADSEKLIEGLLRKYPGDPSLLDFQREVLVKKTMQATSVLSDKEERRTNLIKFAIRGGIVMAIVLVLGGAIYFAFNRYRTNLLSSIYAEETRTVEDLLTSKLEKADSWLKGNRPQDALRELQEIEEINPAFEGVDTLMAEAERQLALLDKYDQAGALYQTGDLNGALEMYNQIISEESNYRDSGQMIQKISDELEVIRLKGQLQTSYQSGDWQGVIDSYDQVVTLDPSADLKELIDVLFESYKERIIEIAGQAEPTLNDIEKAREYYRAAIALVAQNPEFADERRELQEIATQLIANKFFLFAVEQLDAGGYAPDNMREVLRLLQQAASVGSDSGVIPSEIERIELFVTGFDALLDNANDTAIDNLERLVQLEPDYADGFVQYLLYEAYIARGNALTAFADFENARQDYELAETYARGDYGNDMRIFWAEIQIARMLRRLTLHDEAAEYFNFAFNLIDFDDRVRDSGNSELIRAYEDARSAQAVNDNWNAARLFEVVLEGFDVAYTFDTVLVFDGHTIFETAFEYGSTIDAIRSLNELGVATYFGDDMEIQVPYIVDLD